MKLVLSTMFQKILAWAVLIFNGLILGTDSASLAETQCISRDPIIQEDADVFIGVILSLREYQDGVFPCGKVVGDIPALEALVWALDRINQNSGQIGTEDITDSYVPGVKIGLKIVDSCQSKEFDASTLVDWLPRLKETEHLCQTSKTKLFLGILGESDSNMTAAVADFLAQFHISQISYESTASQLGNLAMYPYLLRTLPASQRQINVLIELLKILSWSNFTLVHDNTKEAIHQFNLLSDILEKESLCASTTIALNTPRHGMLYYYQHVISRILVSQTKAVVYIGQKTNYLDLTREISEYKEAGALHWIVLTTDRPLENTDLEHNKYNRGLLTIHLLPRQIPEFENHWVKIDPNDPPWYDSWYQEWFMLKYKCKLKNINMAAFNNYPDCPDFDEASRREQYHPSIQTEGAVLALYTYVRAVRDAHRVLCGGSSGLCAAMFDLTPKRFFTDFIKNNQFTFEWQERVPSLASSNLGPFFQSKRVGYDDTQEIEDVVYSVMNFNNKSETFQLSEVGIFMDKSMSITWTNVEFYDETRTSVLQTPPRFLCTDTKCTECLRDKNIDWKTPQAFYTPGDILIGGIFSLHDKGDDILSCGLFNEEQAQLIAAYQYGIRSVNRLQIFNNGLQLGGVAIDDCSNSLYGAASLMSFLAGDHCEAIPGAEFIFGVSDADFRGLLPKLASEGIDLAVIGYEADGLSIAEEYQYSLAAISVPTINHEVRALALVLKRLSWTYIQLIYSGDHRLLEIVRENLADHQICIAKAHFINQTTLYNELCSEIVNVPNARVLVLFGSKSQYKTILSTMKNHFPDFEEFKIITGPSIGRSLDLVQMYGDTAEGDISFSYRTTNIPGYIEFIREINPFHLDQENSWFKEWYEKAFNCYLNPVHPGSYIQKCFGYPITTALNFRSNDYVISILNSVISFAQGIHKTLASVCGKNYDQVCSNALASNANKTLLMQNIMANKFDDESGNLFEFINKEAPRIIDIHVLEQGSYLEVGTYNSKSGEMAFNEQNIEGLSPLTSSQCSTTSCLECTYMYYERDNHIVLTGDFIIVSLFNLHHIGTSPYSCGTLKLAESIQASEAFIYAIQSINNGTAPVNLHDVQLGAVLFDACSGPLRASRIVGSFYIDEDFMESNIRDTTLAWITSDSEVTLGTANVLKEMNISQLGIHSDAYYLYENAKTADVFYTTSNSVEMVKALASLLTAMDWKYVSVVYSTNDWCLSFLEAIETIFTTRNICVIESYDVSGDVIKTASSDVVIACLETGDLNTLLKTILDKQLIVVAMTDAIFEEIRFPLNAIILNHPLEDKEDFVIYPREILKTWMPDFFPNCNNDPNEDCKIYSTQEARLSTISNAVFAVAEALHLVLSDVCGPAYRGLCKELSLSETPKLIQNKLSLVTFNKTNGNRFEFVDKYFHQGYVLTRMQPDGNSEMIARYHYGNLEFLTTDLDELYLHVISKCPKPCLQCQYLDQQEGHISYQMGDILIGGMFDVHQKGDGPFTCGDVKLNQGVQLLEAFIYAVDTVNQHEGMFENVLNGVKLGFLTLDTCENNHRATNLVTSVHNGIRSLDGFASKRIGVYVGAFDSGMSMLTGDILESIGVPQISYGSSSSDLDRYPMFLRTVPGDNQQAKAIVEFLLQYDLTYLQIVYSNVATQHQASISFLELAERSGICVSQSINANEDDSGLTQDLAEQVIAALQKKANAKVVVVFMESFSIRVFLENIRRSDGFRFIGSSSWSNNLDIIEGLVQFNDEIVTFGVETSDLPGFDSYLTGLDPLHDQHLWFAAYYEEVCQCSLQYRPSSRYKEPCRVTPGGIVRDCPYQQDPYILYTVNAIFSAALGIDNAIKKVCGPHYNGLCDKFIKNDNWRQMVYNGIRETEFIDATNQVFRFSDERESTRGFHIYSVQRIGQNTASYTNVGSYNQTQHLKINTRFSLKWESNCKGSGSCLECPELKAHEKSYVQLSTDNLNLLGFFQVHSSDNRETFGCGQLTMNTGFQNALAFFYAINNTNANNIDVRIGGALVDTCGHPEIATRDALSLITEQGVTLESKQLSLDSIFAVLIDNTESKRGAALLQGESVTVIDVGSSSPDENEYLLSMLPIAQISGAAVAALTEEMGWEYVSLVYNSEQIHITAAEQFVAGVKDTSNMCIAVSISIPTGLTHSEAQEIMKKLANTKGARVVVIFANSDQLSLLISASEILDTNFIFIFGNPVERLGSTADLTPGSIALSLRIPILEGFKDYMRSLTVANHGSIPDRWFEEFWQRLFHCQLQNATMKLTEFSGICSRTDRISQEKITVEFSALYTFIATYVAITGFLGIPECQASSSLSNCLSPMSSRRNSIYRRIKESQWIESNPQGDDFLFRFSEDGLGEIEIQLRNAVLDGKTKLTFKQIGSYRDGILFLNKEDYEAYDSNERPTKTVLSQCVTGSNCDCTNDTGLPENNPSEDPETSDSDDQALGSNFEKPWGMLMGILSGLSFFLTFFLMVFLIVCYPTRGGTTYVAYFILIGLMSIFALNFVFILQASDTICGIRRFCLALCYSIIYSSMLVKVVYLWRSDVYQKNFFDPLTDKALHPVTLFLIALALVAVQVAFGAEWLCLEKPESIILDESRRCAPLNTHHEELVLSCLYPMFLLFLTTIFSGMNWDNDENNYECRSILISIGSNVSVWVAWLALVLSQDLEQRDPIITIANLCCGLSILFGVFGRKLYMLHLYKAEDGAEERGSPRGTYSPSSCVFVVGWLHGG